MALEGRGYTNIINITIIINTKALIFMKVIILGVGNLLLSDEGVGVQAIQILLRDYVMPTSVEVIDGGTAGLELCALIAHADCLILLDAVINTEYPPGTVIRLDNEEVPRLFRTKLSFHQIGLAEVLAALKLTGEYPKQVILFGIVPAKLELGLELSAPVASQLPYLLKLVRAEVERLGFSLRSSR